MWLFIILISIGTVSNLCLAKYFDIKINIYTVIVCILGFLAGISSPIAFLLIKLFEKALSEDI